MKRAAVLVEPRYRDRHVGRTFVVLGNGPSLTSHRAALHALIAAEQAVVLGANHVTPFAHPDYHAFTNRKRFVEYARTIDPARSRVLLSPYFTEKLIRAHYGGGYELLQYVAENDAHFGIDERGVILASCRTVSALLIGVAAVMGAGRIVVVGLDGFPEGRPEFHAETAVLKGEQAVLTEVEAYTRRFLAEIQAYLEANGRTRFAIATPTTYAEHYDAGILAEVTP